MKYMNAYYVQQQQLAKAKKKMMISVRKSHFLIRLYMGKYSGVEVQSINPEYTHLQPNFNNMPNYRKSRDEAVRTIIAQKISQKIDSLPQIDCVSQRWIWELIQNAKDAGSEFDMIKIKIDIYDNNLVFSHNGDPFSAQNIESLAFHFSAKQEQNREDVETTGKYGTGFMVTYVISKIVKLKCKVKGFQEEDQQESSDDEEQEFSQQMRFNQYDQDVQDHINLSPSVKQQQVDYKGSTNRKQDLKEQKAQKKMIAEMCYYQDLYLTLDRDYSNIEQLKEKIRKLDKSLDKQRNKGKKTIDYVRTQESFDTVFTYQKLDNNAFSHIKQGIMSLRKLFLLTLLFNQKLYSVEVNNYSKRMEGIHSFEIVLQNDMKNPMKIGLQQIFTAAIYDYQRAGQKDQMTKSLKQYLFQTNQPGQDHSIIAFPVKMVNDKIHLLRFQDNFPKIFKQFPLIGSQDTGFNFAFTSKQFYPSQTRKQLLLRQFEGRKGVKAEKNWQILHQIYDQAFNMYVLLAPKIQKGKFNLFIIPEHNQFTKQIHQKHKMVLKFDKIRNFMFKAQIFPNTLDTKSCFQDLELIYDTNSQLSLEAYEQLSFLLKNTLPSEQYKEFCDIVKIQSVRHRLYDKRSFLTIEYCLNLLAKMKFQQLVKQFGDYNNSLFRLQRIYRLLAHNKRSLLYSKKIILTQDLQFKGFNFDGGLSNLQIQVQFKHKKEYLEIASQLGLFFKSSLVHNHFTHIFEQEYNRAQQLKIEDHRHFSYQEQRVLSIKFQEIDVMNKINSYFVNYPKVKLDSNSFGADYYYSSKDVIMLGRYISSFQYQPYKQIGQADIAKAILFKQFRQMNIPLCQDKILLKIKEGIQINQSLAQSLRTDISKRIILSYKRSKTISEFASLLVDDNKEIAFEFISGFFNNHCSYLQHIPNADQQIVRDTSRQLRELRQGYSILNQEDFYIYNQFYQKCNRQFGTQLIPLEKTLVHPRIIPPTSSPFRVVTFFQLFVCIRNLYNLTTDTKDKEIILNYTFRIYQDYFIKNNTGIKCKFEAFKDIINARHLEFGKLLDSLSETDKDFICKIFKMKDQFASLNQIISNYNIEEILATMKRVNPNPPKK